MRLSGPSLTTSAACWTTWQMRHEQLPGNHTWGVGVMQHPTFCMHFQTTHPVSLPSLTDMAKPFKAFCQCIFHQNGDVDIRSSPLRNHYAHVILYLYESCSRGQICINCLRRFMLPLINTTGANVCEQLHRRHTCQVNDRGWRWWHCTMVLLVVPPCRNL